MKTCIQLVPQLIKAREKHRQSFRDCLERIVTNLTMYLDVLRPRSFDAPDLATEVP